MEHEIPITIDLALADDAADVWALACVTIDRYAPGTAPTWDDPGEGPEVEFTVDRLVRVWTDADGDDCAEDAPAWMLEAARGPLAHADDVHQHLAELADGDADAALADYLVDLHLSNLEA